MTAETRRADAESRGWRVIVEKPPHEREVPGGLFERVPGYFEAEATVLFPSSGPGTHRLAATSLEKLLDEVDAFDARLGRV